MTTKLTTRDKKLLILLAFFLIGVGFTFLILLPGIEKRGKLQEQITEAEIAKCDMDQEIAMLPIYERDLVTNKEKHEALIRDFYPRMESQQVDKMLTNIVLSYQLESKDLTVSVTPQSRQILLYGQTLEDVEAEKKAAAEEAERVKQEAAAADTKKAEPADTETPVAEPPNFGEVQISDITIVAVGEMNNIQRLIDSMSNDYKAIRVVGYELVDKENQAVNIDPLAPQVQQADIKQLTLQMELYMCDKDS